MDLIIKNKKEKWKENERGSTRMNEGKRGGKCEDCEWVFETD